MVGVFERFARLTDEYRADAVGHPLNDTAFWIQVDNVLPHPLPPFMLPVPRYFGCPL